jgi:hypothetical protein
MLMALGATLVLTGLALVTFSEPLAPIAHYLLLLPALSTIAYLYILDKLQSSGGLLGKRSQTLLHLKQLLIDNFIGACLFFTVSLLILLGSALVPEGVSEDIALISVMGVTIFTVGAVLYVFAKFTEPYSRFLALFPTLSVGCYIFAVNRVKPEGLSTQAAMQTSIVDLFQVAVVGAMIFFVVSALILAGFHFLSSLASHNRQDLKTPAPP